MQRDAEDGREDRETSHGVLVLGLGLVEKYEGATARPGSLIEVRVEPRHDLAALPPVVLADLVKWRPGPPARAGTAWADIPTLVIPELGERFRRLPRPGRRCRLLARDDCVEDRVFRLFDREYGESGRRCCVLLGPFGSLLRPLHIRAVAPPKPS